MPISSKLELDVTAQSEASKKGKENSNSNEQKQKWVIIDGDKYRTVYAKIEDSQADMQNTQEEDQSFNADDDARDSILEFTETSNTAEPIEPIHRIKKMQPRKLCHSRHPDYANSDASAVSSIYNLHQHPHHIKVIRKEVQAMSLWQLICTFSNLCCVFCPPCPFPTQIILNAAFHPPPRNRNYLLIDNKNRKTFNDAKEAARCSSVVLKSKFAPKNLNITKDGKPKLQVAIVETSRKHHIVTVHIRCKKSIENGIRSPKLIIFSQPNSTDLGYTLFLTNPDLICDFLKCDLIAYDYSGFGASTGKISEKALYADIEAVFKHAITVMKYRAIDVILIGFSMGTAMSIHMASIEEKLGGLVLIAPFTSLLRAASRVPCCGREADSDDTCCYDQFSSYDKVSLIKARTLLCHGTLDTLVVREHSEVLYKRLKNATQPYYVQTCHTGIFENTSTWVHIKRFFNEELLVDALWADLTKTKMLLKKK